MQHPWTRYVAIGDSFTEGVGDDEPSLPNGVRGWADRLAEELARTQPDLAYANLAVRGRLLDQIVAEQVDAALALQPDLITISAGGNDLLRPGADPDRVAGRLERAIERLSVDGATVVLFNGPDIGMTPVLRSIRGRVAIYNCDLGALARRHDAIVADMWAATELRDPRMWAPDRLHFSALGHHRIAMLVLDALGVEHDLHPQHPEPLPHRTWRQAASDDILWAREYFGPWVVRRLTGRSSGDAILAKRPLAEPVLRPREDGAPSMDAAGS